MYRVYLKWIMRDYYELIKVYVLSNVPQIGIWSKTFQNSRTRSFYFEATNFGVWLEIQLESFKNYEEFMEKYFDILMYITYIATRT